MGFCQSSKTSRENSTPSNQIIQKPCYFIFFTQIFLGKTHLSPCNKSQFHHDQHFQIQKFFSEKICSQWPMGNTNKKCQLPKTNEDGKEAKTRKKAGKKRFKKPVTEYKWVPYSSHCPTVLPALTGTNINAFYDVGYELGRGEFGITYLCTEKSTGKKYACKSIAKSKLRTQVDIEDVKREVEIMEHLPSHNNIVKLVSTYEDDMEIVQVCHENGVMHRDLEPENFLFGSKKENASLKAIDFGLSVFFLSQDKSSMKFREPVLMEKKFSGEIFSLQEPSF